MTSGPTGRAVFEAVITPHRSLSRRGLMTIIGVIGALSLLISVGLWFAGAWPVIGFDGLEIALAAWLLLRHAAVGSDSEILLLDEDGLRVIRSRRGRRSEMVVGAGWLRADLEERLGRAPALMVRARGVALEVAASLGEEEKRDLAQALRAALERQRAPVFDNPQLRD